MSKYTKGPWSYVNHSWNTTGIYDANSSIVATLKIDDDCDWEEQDELEIEQEANAKLISAAPELLEALEKAVNRQGFSNDELIAAREVINKAKNIVKNS